MLLNSFFEKGVFSMKILVTGSDGFIARNLITELENRGYDCLYKFDRTSDKELLEGYTKDCDFVFHLAGVNRPDKEDEFMEGNYGFTSELLELLKANNNPCPIMLASSI